MANIKSVSITGKIPFFYYENKELCEYMAFIQSPASGLNIEFEDVGYENNEHGGRTMMFRFSLTGQESKSFDWFKNFCYHIQSTKGSIDEESIVMDMLGGLNETIRFDDSREDKDISAEYNRDGSLTLSKFVNGFLIKRRYKCCLNQAKEDFKKTIK